MISDEMNTTLDFSFWTTPLYWEKISYKGITIHSGVTPFSIMKECVQPWKTALNMLLLN